MPRGKDRKRSREKFQKGHEDEVERDPAKLKAARIDGTHLVRCFEEHYDELLDEKINAYATLLSTCTDMKKEDIEVFESPKSGFRMRANFSMWRDLKFNDDPDNLYFCMFDTSMRQTKEDRGIKKACEIHSFPRASLLINFLMTELLHLINRDHEAHPVVSKKMRKSLFEVRFVGSQIGHMTIILIYRDELDEEWNTAAHQALGILQQKCDEQLANNNTFGLIPEKAIGDTTSGKSSKEVKVTLKIVGRAYRHKVLVDAAGGKTTYQIGMGQDKYSSLESEMITEHYIVHGERYVNYQIEGAFTQPNATVCQKMLEWSSTVTSDPGDGEKEMDKDKDLLELYCGGGTFTTALAKNFRKVLATELSKASVELAQHAITANNIDNIKVVPLTSEQFTEWYEGGDDASKVNAKTLKIAQEAQIRVSDYNINTVLVDPPRNGLDNETCTLLSKFNNIVYISCKPETQVRDIKKLNKTHQVVKVAAFDQFPYTEHLEGGVHLKKRDAPLEE